MITATAVCKRLQLLSTEHTSSGAVHSVFDHAVNLELAGRSGLIGLIAEGKPLTPYAASVRTDIPFTQAGVCAGMAALLRNGRIELPQMGIEIDLAAAKAVDLCVDSIEMRYDRNAADALTEQITAVLLRADAQASLAPLITGSGGNAYSRFLEPRLNELTAAVSLGAEDAAIQAASRVAGCGMGLTPSSDDLLTGYLFTLHLVLREQGRGDARRLIPRMAQAAAERTNRISATFLLQSGEGLANAAICDLFRSMFQFMDPAAARRALERVFEIGSTSGADMLAGIALALRKHYGGSEE